MAVPSPSLIDLSSALRLRRGFPAPAPPAQWSLSALSGCLAEISTHGSGAALTLAFALVLDAQQQREPVAWITTAARTFFPPDAAAGGVDLSALAVVRVAEARFLPRAADHLARSGAFGLIVLDLGPRARVPMAMQSRLVGLAQKHDALILFLTEKKADQSSLGSLISVRAEATRTRIADDQFRCEAHILKDKRRGPGWVHAEVCRGPDGLR